MIQTGLQLVDLRQVDLRQLEPLLAEEQEEWASELEWDFAPNAEQIRRFVGPRTLPGVALLDGEEVAGYGYTILEEPKGLVGDIYLRRRWREADSEVRLFKILLDALTGTPGVRRVESQLMLVAPEITRTLALDRFVRLFERRLMVRDPLVWLQPVGAAAVDERFRFMEWEPSGRAALAQLIVRAYEGHVDGQINDQFLTEAGAVGFLRSLLENAGCGEFFRPGSLFAIDRRTEWLAGVVLTSFVASDTAHITQLCVGPEARGLGLGRELLRRAMPPMGEAGARKVTLSVTASNEKASRLYERAGFAEMRRFCAVVWDDTARMSHS